jgi:AcrR family transcriptional regulator
MFASSGLKTSLKEIGDACGIQPGSLYHHFDSKEAIIIELVQRYQKDLDRVAHDAMATVETGSRTGWEQQVISFGRAIAATGIRHRGALLLTLYEPPSVLGEELARLARKTPSAIGAAMLAMLQTARGAGAIRAGVNLEQLAERMCQSMLHIGVGVSYLSPSGEQVPEMRLRIFLHGIATRPPSKRALDSSDGLRTARGLIDGWDDDVEDHDRMEHIRAVARTEFGKRGYEATTIRDIAASAGLSTGTVYRVFGSKEDILASIMRSYGEKVTHVWDAVIRSSSSPLEKIDALLWVNINVVDRFSDEFKIQLAWLRQSPPSTPSLSLSFLEQLRQVKALLAAGTQTGDIHLGGSTADVRARCVFETIWTPDNIVQSAGRRSAHALARDTVLSGAAVRS